MGALRILLAVVTTFSVVASVLVLTIEPPETELGTLWHKGAPASLNLTQAVTQRYIHPVFWSHVLLPVLLTPAWAVFAAIAVLALLLWLLLWLPLWRRRKTN